MPKIRKSTGPETGPTSFDTTSLSSAEGLSDFATPSSPVEVVERRLDGSVYAGARWDATSLGTVMEHLTESESALKAVAGERLATVWQEAVDELRRRCRDPESPLHGVLVRASGLSSPGLTAAVDQILDGVVTRAAVDLLMSSAPLSGPSGGSVVVSASSNLPALAVQSLLPALVSRRPLLVKSASAEPFFAPAFIAALARREPVLGRALAAVTWPGGDLALERAACAPASRLIAYGDGDTERALRSRWGAKLLMHGPKISLAVLGDDVAPLQVAPGLARDVALFDQRGCLSIQAVVVVGDRARETAQALLDPLADALAELSRSLPPGPLGTAKAAARHWRDEAIMGGLSLADLPLSAGTVIVDGPSAGLSAGPSVLQPSPGGRCLRIHPSSTDGLAVLLEPWRGRLQGVAVAGALPSSVPSLLQELGVTHVASPGELQAPDVATWHNGGVAPLRPFLD